jgi:hypothetical protein
MRRNDIVMESKGEGWSPYGRINRRVGDKWEVIDCMRNISLYAETELNVCNDYKGFHEHYNERFIRMPTLRRLKQMAARYNKRVWKRFHKC